MRWGNASMGPLVYTSGRRADAVLGETAEASASMGPLVYTSGRWGV